MDLGCLDLGCIEKQVSQSCGDSDVNPNDSLPSTSKSLRNKILKEAKQAASPRALNRLTTQIKKPPRRKTSPLGWFPRKKVDSYLKRKLKLLQEVDGMNATLDETLGDTNPHFSKVLKEKIAVREAAQKAIEARKAALVEASWCKILKAARIESKEAETVLVKAEETAAEAFESAKEIGVIMYDIQDCPRKHYKIETSVNGSESKTHTVSTSFDTAFEVDKQVAAAVKAAFVRLSTSASIGKEEFKELLKKISQNPDLDENENHQATCESASECESDPGLDFDSGSKKTEEMESEKGKQRENLVNMLLQRLRCLKEEELASLATIVATCGLNAALAESENSFPNSGFNSFEESKSQEVEEVPGLDKFLVKRLTRLEKEILEAKNARTKETRDNGENGEGKISKDVKVVPDLGSMLKKHTSKFEKAMEETKKKCGNEYEPKNRRSERLKQETKEIPSLGEVLVKRVSRLEREVQEAKKEKENMNTNKETGVKEKRLDLSNNGVESLDKVLVKRVSRFEKEKTADVAAGDVAAEEVKNPLLVRREARERELREAWGGMSFGNSIRPRLSRLQRDKAEWLKAEKEERREEPKVV